VLYNALVNKLRPITGNEGPGGGSRGMSTLSLTMVLDGGMCGQCHAPALLSPGKKRYPLCRRLGGRPVCVGAENLAGPPSP
jgi:hypothetical protein